LFFLVLFVEQANQGSMNRKFDLRQANTFLATVFVRFVGSLRPKVIKKINNFGFNLRITYFD
jgi:hypothetical protein